ncbi:M4 family metallopeptidase [Streptomyces sp. CA-253872]|uniref:M4 family metallopeptidase n=1 Tax=Streptomyces sp. CA-253872 TaxID=3240067 RepID=UPI003D904ED6
MSSSSTRRIRLAAATSTAALLCGLFTTLPAQAAPPQTGSDHTPDRVAGSHTKVPSFVRGLKDRAAKSASGKKETPAVAAEEHLAQHDDVFHTKNLDLSKPRSSTVDGRTTVSFTQRHKGIPVLGAEYKVHTKGTEVESASGSLFTDLKVGATPKLTSKQAQNRLFADESLRKLSPEGRTIEAHDLVVLPKGEGILTYHFTVKGTQRSGEPVSQQVFVDAHTGGIAFSYNDIAGIAAAGTAASAPARARAADAEPGVTEGPVTATGTTYDGDTVDLNAYQRADGKVELRDQTQTMFQKTGGEILTYDAQRGDVKNYQSVLPADTPLAAADSTEFPAEATDTGAVDAHTNAAKVYAFYKKQFKRDGIDGKGGTMRSVVNVTSNGVAYPNAFWDGTKMVYGNINGAPASVGLDVVGHEMTHGITEHTAGLLYVSQSGALNEAISDYFGEAMEVDDEGLAMNDPMAGLIGEDLCGHDEDPATCALRDLSDGRRADRDFINIPLASDNGGVHSNSTIIGGAMWDMRKSLSKKFADNVIYTAALENFTPWTDFLQARYGIVDAARRLGATNTQLQKINNAFDAHGIVPGWEDVEAPRDAVTLAKDVAPGAEGMDMSHTIAVDGDRWATSYVDLKSFFDGTPEYGIKTGKISQPEKGANDISTPGVWMIDPALKGNKLYYSRVGVNGADIVSRPAGGGKNAQETVVAGGPGDQREADVDGNVVTWVDIQGDEADVWVRQGSKPAVNITPEPGTSAVRPQIAGGKVSFIDYGGASTTMLNVYDLATKKLTVTKAGDLLSSATDYVSNGKYGFAVITNPFLLGFQSAKGYDLSDPANTAKQKSVKLRSIFGSGVQLAANDTQLVRTDLLSATLGGATNANMPKLEVADVEDVMTGDGGTWQRVSCAPTGQMYPGMDDGSQRVVWADTRGTTDIVTRETPAGACS